MKKCKLILYLIVFWTSTLVFSQNALSFKDSIGDLSLFTLDNLTVDLETSHDTVRANIVANQLLTKAMKDDEYDYVARAYFTKSTLERSLNVRTKYIDSMMFYTQISGQDYLLSDAYFQKGEVNYLMGNYEMSMENLAEAYRYALLDKNSEQQLLIETYMAIIKDVLGRYYEANEILKGSFNHYDKLNFEDLERKEAFLAVIYNLTLSNVYLEQPDSTLYYVQRGRLCLKDIYYPRYENLFKRSEAIANLYLSEYETALKLFNESLVGLSEHDLAHSHYYIAESFSGLGKEKKAIEYFIKADSILEISGAKPFEDMTLAYKLLFNHFTTKNSPDKALRYLNKYFYLDSVLKIQKQAVSEKLHKLYSLPRVKSEQQKILEKRRINRIVITTLIMIIAIAIIIIIFQRIKLRKQRINANNIIKKDTQQIFRPLATITKKPEKKSLDDNVYDNILDRLKEFEVQKGFLDSHVNIHNLSKMLGTNTTYLSKFMNERMDMGFPTYLKTLRINHAVNMLKQDVNLLKYSMNGLASEFGFNSADTFSRAFKEVAKTSPSIFIKEVTKSKNMSDNF